MLPRRLRFTLLTLLVLVTSIAIALGFVTREWRSAHRKRQVAETIQHIGGRVTWGKPPEAKGTIRGWLHFFLGDAYFAEARDVSFRPRSEGDLDLLHTFPGLEWLGLSGQGVTDGAIERLTSHEQLRELQLTNAVIGQPGLNALSRLPSLSYLRFSSCALSDVASERGLLALRALPGVTNISFQNCGLTDDSLKALCGLPSLVDLYLNEPKVTEVGILFLRSANPALSINFDVQRSYFGSQLVLENCLPSAAKMPHVKELAFKGPCTSDRILPILKETRSLTSLRLERCRISDDGLEHLGTLMQLTKLELFGTHVSEARLSELRRAPELATLESSDCRITDAGLEHLRNLNAMTELRVVDCQITDDGMKCLQALKSLSSLTISGSGITDEGMKCLQALKSLSSLTIIGSGITDEGLRQLHELPHLSQLTLFNTSISDEGIAGIRQALPGCVVSNYPQNK